MVSEVRHVLLVEDNPAHAKLVTRIFRDFGEKVRIHHVSDGEAALEYLFQEAAGRSVAGLPNLVLLDLRIPKYDGLTVLQKIKEDPFLRHIPVVVLTTSDAESDVRGAFDRCANSYLVKPIEYLQFVRLVRALGTYWTELNHTSPSQV